MYDESRGMTLIGILVSMAIIVVLAAIGMTAMQGSMGGTGTPVQQNQATTFQDRMNIQQIGQSLMAWSSGNNSRLPTPSRMAGRENDIELNTTAAFWSSLIAQSVVHPSMLVSRNDRNFNVNEYTDSYNYNPTTGDYWDPNFKADLETVSHVSFAHEPLYGARFRRNWTMAGPTWFPLLGNRGPENGVNNPDSLACDVTGVWAGNMVYADGHAAFHKDATAAGGGRDNIFHIESWDGEDAVITFTKEIWSRGFEPQWD